jgi:hypothetical protein
MPVQSWSSSPMAAGVAVAVRIVCNAHSAATLNTTAWQTGASGDPGAAVPPAAGPALAPEDGAVTATAAPHRQLQARWRRTDPDPKLHDWHPALVVGLVGLGQL